MQIEKSSYDEGSKPTVPPNLPEETGLKGRCEGREGVLMK